MNGLLNSSGTDKAVLTAVENISKKIDVLREDVLSQESQDNSQSLYGRTTSTCTPNNLPPRNPKFFGREAILSEMHKAFIDDNVSTRVQTISGFGGIGKTQTVLEYAYLHFNEYEDGLCWIDAESRETLFGSLYEFSKINGYMGQTSKDALQEWFLQWLGARKKYLIIIDNAEDESSVSPYLSHTVNGYILITTRANNFARNRSISLPVFSEMEAKNYLLKRTGIVQDETTATSIAERLGRFPLALEQAAAYILACNCSYKHYGNLLNAYGLDIFNDADTKPIDYKYIVTTTWNVSIKKLRSVAALQFLKICSYLNPDNIPINIFTEHTECLPKPLCESSGTMRKLDDIVKDVLRFSLFQRSGNMISIHRLVQEVIRNDNQRANNQAAILEQLKKRCYRLVRKQAVSTEFTCFFAAKKLICVSMPRFFTREKEASEISAVIYNHYISVCNYYINHIDEIEGISFKNITSSYDPLPTNITPTTKELSVVFTKNIGIIIEQFSAYLDNLETHTKKSTLLWQHNFETQLFYTYYQCGSFVADVLLAEKYYDDRLESISAFPEDEAIKEPIRDKVEAEYRDDCRVNLTHFDHFAETVWVNCNSMLGNKDNTREVIREIANQHLCVGSVYLFFDMRDSAKLHLDKYKEILAGINESPSKDVYRLLINAV